MMIVIKIEKVIFRLQTYEDNNLNDNDKDFSFSDDP